MSRSLFVRAAAVALATATGLAVLGCTGQRSFFAGRPFPPSTILQRVLVAIQYPSPASPGALQIVDARYDIRNAENGKIPVFFINGYSGALPNNIQNYPEETSGYVYGYGDGSLTPINYSTESKSAPISGIPGLSSSVFVTSNGAYAFAANQGNQYLTVIDRVLGAVVYLNLPNVYKISVNPSGTVVLAFVQNSDYAYRVIRLQQPNGTVMPVPTFPNEANWPKNVSPVNCQPLNLPIYCVAPVLDQAGNPIAFDRPYKTVFSSDGTTGWVLNCGPECGNTSVDPVTNAVDPVTKQGTASVSFLNTGPLNIYNFPGSTYPSPPPANPPPTEQRRVPVPGGATMAVYGNNTLYISGQQLQPDGLLEGFLSVMNLATNQVTANYPISDGTHTKMLLGDDNTLWIGSQQCQTGERTALNLSNSCLTWFNTATNKVSVESTWNGDLTGLCAILEWHKMYTAQGGQLHIYATTNSGITTTTVGYSAGSELYNGNVTVQGTAYDVAYMDAPSDAGD